MRNRNRSHLNVMRGIFLSILLLCVLSLTAFSLQTMYSNNVQIEYQMVYGIYQNGVFLGTDGVMVPSPYAVQKALISVRNMENSTRRITVTVEYRGMLQKIDPGAGGNSTMLSWDETFAPYELKTLSFIGTGLAMGTPMVYVNGAAEPENATNKRLVLDNLSNGSKAQPANFSYVREEEVADVLQPLFEEQRKIDVLAKSMIVIFAGLAMLTFASGFSFVFGSERGPGSREPRKAKIHIGDFYHENGTADEFSKYKYEESDYWGSR